MSKTWKFMENFVSLKCFQCGKLQSQQLWNWRVKLWSVATNWFSSVVQIMASISACNPSTAWVQLRWTAAFKSNDNYSPGNTVTTTKYIEIVIDNGSIVNRNSRKGCPVRGWSPSCPCLLKPCNYGAASGRLYRLMLAETFRSWRLLHWKTFT
jgi:hypothetical protein